MGRENIFIFGMTVDQVEELQKRGYNAFDYYNANAELKRVVDQVTSPCPVFQQPLGFS